MRGIYGTHFESGVAWRGDNLADLARWAESRLEILSNPRIDELCAMQGQERDCSNATLIFRIS